MAQLVTAGAVLQCTFGTLPCPLVVLPANKVLCGTPAATIQDHIPVTNIASFTMCKAPTNPAVVAKAGSPAPCVPIITDPWAPGSPTVKIGTQPALNSTSKCMCKYLGIISVQTPAQTTTTVA